MEILLVPKDFAYYDYFDYVQVMKGNADVGLVDTFSFTFDIIYNDNRCHDRQNYYNTSML